jgi:DNA-directed RNA polymerase sigma subunit (sigma70/sigma32)
MEAIGTELGITGERARQLLSGWLTWIRMMIVAAEAV